MKSIISKLALAIVSILAFALVGSRGVYADEGIGTSISISPVSKILQLQPSTSYEDHFTITNNSESPMDFEVYAAPYAYIYSETDDAYKLGFNKENNYTQIVRWITFKDTNGNFVEKTTFTADPNGNIDVYYKITTPEDIPAGGQYAVLFAHTLSATTNASGIKTEASPGLVVYGRSEGGETIISSEVSDLKINQTMMVEGEEKTIINGTGKVKNTGNVDFMATGTLKVTGIFGNVYYETTGQSTKSRISVIPDTELTVTDSWDETPFFGIFNVEWTVYANGEASETISKLIVIIPPVLIIVMILLLTIIIVWIIILIRKRRERRSRFMI